MHTGCRYVLGPARLSVYPDMVEHANFVDTPQHFLIYVKSGCGNLDHSQATGLCRGLNAIFGLITHI